MPGGKRHGNNCSTTRTFKKQRSKENCHKAFTLGHKVAVTCTCTFYADQNYSDVFYIEGQPLAFTDKIKDNIDTTDQQPLYRKGYKYPFVHRQEVKNQVANMLGQRLIRPSLVCVDLPHMGYTEKGRYIWRSEMAYSN